MCIRPAGLGDCISILYTDVCVTKVFSQIISQTLTLFIAYVIPQHTTILIGPEGLLIDKGLCPSAIIRIVNLIGIMMSRYGYIAF